MPSALEFLEDYIDENLYSAFSRKASKWSKNNLPVIHTKDHDEITLEQEEARKKHALGESCGLGSSSSSSLFGSNSSLHSFSSTHSCNSDSSSSAKSRSRKQRKLKVKPNSSILPQSTAPGSNNISTTDRWFPACSGDRSAATILKRASVISRTNLTKHDTCSVCMEEFIPEDDSDGVEGAQDVIVKLGNCVGHYFHKDCITNSLKYSARCPNCFHVYGELKGTQPPGSMSVMLVPHRDTPLSGFSSSTDTIIVSYHFPCGVQTEEHPHPGVHFTGTSRFAYLPHNKEGVKVLHLLQKAWDARLIFRVGQSVTTGADNTVVWNGIHHKTSTCGGSCNFGFPDATYFQRVTEELASVGIYPD